jgi:hypothetical protein
MYTREYTNQRIINLSTEGKEKRTTLKTRLGKFRKKKLRFVKRRKGLNAENNYG